jgi:hypothetical protein
VSGVSRTGFTLSLVVVLVAVGAVASAEAIQGHVPQKLHHNRTFFLAAGRTRTFKVSYREALKFGRSKYSGRVVILRACRPRKPCPEFTKVHVLGKGSCFGGSDFCARVRNDNRSGTQAVGVRVSAITKLPPSGTYG